MYSTRGANIKKSFWVMIFCKIYKEKWGFTLSPFWIFNILKQGLVNYKTDQDQFQGLCLEIWFKELDSSIYRHSPIFLLFVNKRDLQALNLRTVLDPLAVLLLENQLYMLFSGSLIWCF